MEIRFKSLTYFKKILMGSHLQSTLNKLWENNVIIIRRAWDKEGNMRTFITSWNAEVNFNDKEKQVYFQ